MVQRRSASKSLPAGNRLQGTLLPEPRGQAFDEPQAAEQDLSLNVLPGQALVGVLGDECLILPLGYPTVPAELGEQPVHGQKGRSGRKAGRGPIA